MAVLMTPPYLTFFDNSTPGIPLAGGKIYTYAAGTTTPKATFTDSTEAVQATNPIVLDAQGRATPWISGSYKFVIKDALGNTIRTTDNVTSYSIAAAATNAYFQTFSGDAVTTVFTTSQDLGTDENALFIDVDAGAGKGYDPLNPNAYTINGTALTFAVAPAVGVNNIFVRAPLTLLNAASAAAAAAATSETNAAASAVLASQWASQTSGIVAVTDFSAKAWAIGGTGVTGVAAKGAAKEWATLTSGAVDTSGFSSKAWAIGGTGVTTSASGGAAKEWATTTGGAVDTSEFSAKEYATGTTATLGSAKSWATLTSGLVATTDGSSKAWAIGGTGISSTAAKGAAKEWATKTSASVDTVDFSAKEFAIGTQAATGGSAKNWAQQTAADVTGASANSRSAKSWAQDNNTGATLGGSAKDWAQSASLPDGTSKSAKSYAADAAASATTAQGYAAALTDTSTTSLAIGTGAKVFTVTAAKAFAAGQFFSAASAANNANFMHGTVTSYSGTTLTTNVTDIGGSGTKTDWQISISGSQGSTGPAGSLQIANAAGTADAITADFTPDLVLADNLVIQVVNTAGVNTVTNPTLNTDASGALTIKARGNTALVAGDTGAAGYTMTLRYEATGTYWELQNPAANISLVAASEAADTTCFLAFFNAASGAAQQLKYNASLGYNASTGALSAGSFTGAGTGLTGTAASLTAGNVTTNANMTGDVTSSGSNATTVVNVAGRTVANTAVTVASNAGTAPVTTLLDTFTNSSAATMAITLATAGATDGQKKIVRIYDFSAVTQTIGWTNTENSSVSVPTTSNGSTTLPLTVGFMYNSATSKWRCVASA